MDKLVETVVHPALPPSLDSYWDVVVESVALLGRLL